MSRLPLSSLSWLPPAGRSIVRLICAAAVIFAAPPLFAVERVQESIQVDEFGNAECEMRLRVTEELVEGSRKAKEPMDMFGLIQRLDWWADWRLLTLEKCHYDEEETTVRARYSIAGLATIVGDDAWQIYFEQPIVLSETTSDDAIKLKGRVETPFGARSALVEIELPRGATDVVFEEAAQHLTYRLAQGAASHKTDDVGFELDAQPQLMSSLGAAYGKSAFDELWVARAIVENRTGETLQDLQIRFRIDGFTRDWSEPFVSAEVQPGQTVVAPFFPLLDVSALLGLNGVRPTVLQVEYSYVDAAGERQTKTASSPLEILGRNETYYSSIPAEMRQSFYAWFNCGPEILAAFVTHEDPLIQQLAGWVSGQGDGHVTAASLDDEHAKLFLRNLFELLQANQIAYQTAPGGGAFGNTTQHVKFGRDVLRNRAGTCIDLAILVASACEAVGLQPVLCLIPGHCFPAIRLPQSGELVAVEATMIPSSKYSQAQARGQEELQAILDGSPGFLVDVRMYHDQGATCLELPGAPAEGLSAWDIRRLEDLDGQERGRDEELASDEDRRSPRRDDEGRQRDREQVGDADDLVGRWEFVERTRSGETSIVLTFRDNGRYSCEIVTVDRRGEEQREKIYGEYEVSRGRVRLTPRGQQEGQLREFRLDDDGLWLEFDEIEEGVELLFTQA